MKLHEMFGNGGSSDQSKVPFAGVRVGDGFSVSNVHGRSAEFIKVSDDSAYDMVKQKLTPVPTRTMVQWIGTATIERSGRAPTTTPAAAAASLIPKFGGGSGFLKRR